MNENLAHFAGLHPDSSLDEINAAVSMVVDALIASVNVTTDIRAARRDVAKLLDYLHALKASRHPGRVQLATELGERVLPLLYVEEPPEEEVKDNYPFVNEEAAAAERAAEIMADVLAFLCAKDSNHPRHGKEIRDDGIAPMCLFTMEFREGFRRLILALFRNFMRNKHSETSVYRQVRDILANDGNGDISRFDRQINSLVMSALDRAQDHYHKADAVPDEDGAEIPAEAEAARDAFQVAHLHAKESGYFIPYSMDFKTLAQVYTLDRKLIRQGLVELGNAVTQQANESYLIRQIDRLNDTHDIVHFDVTVLSAFMFGSMKERISYKHIHDACLGAAKTRDGMIQMRPLLVAELARRPHQLARRLVKLADDPAVDAKEFEAIIDLFTRWLSCLNKRRFEDEISSCAAHMKGKPVLRPMLKWIFGTRCNLDLVPTAMADTTALRSKLFEAG